MIQSRSGLWSLLLGMALLEEEPVALTERSKQAPIVQALEVTPDQFANFRSPSVNDLGEIAIFGLHLLREEPSQSGQRLYLRTLDGNWQLLLRSGEEAADMHINLTELTKPSLSSQKGLTFISQFRSTKEIERIPEPLIDPSDPAYSRTSAPDLGIFRKTADGVRMVLLSGGEVPNMPSTPKQSLRQRQGHYCFHWDLCGAGWAGAFLPRQRQAEYHCTKWTENRFE